MIHNSLQACERDLREYCEQRLDHAIATHVDELQGKITVKGVERPMLEQFIMHVAARKDIRQDMAHLFADTQSADRFRFGVGMLGHQGNGITRAVEVARARRLPSKSKSSASRNANDRVRLTTRPLPIASFSGTSGSGTPVPLPRG